MSSTYFAKFRDHDGTVRVVPTGCRDESTAKQVFADVERRAERVKSGVASPAEMAIAGHVTSPIGKHIADYTSTLTGSASHRENTERYLRTLAGGCRWARLADLRRDDLELWLVD